MDMPASNHSKAFSARNYKGEGIGGYCPSYGCAVIVHDMDGETVKAQYVVYGSYNDPTEATKLREYKIMYRKIDRACYGDDYDPEGDGTHAYIRIWGMSVALDEIMGHGGRQ
jgi:hypothetical protein